MINYEMELREEIDGAVKYHQEALEQKKNGCIDCEFFMAMAKDEMTHAKYIHDYIVSRAIPIPQDLEDTYNRFLNAHKKQ